MIRLEAGSWQAEILPERGARVSKLRLKGIPILREASCPADLAADPALYGIPFLFPPNRTADGKFRFEGIEYSLPINEPLRHNHIHGLFVDAPFTVQKADDCQLCVAIENEGEWFPFPCRVEIFDTISQCGFRRETKVVNTGSRRMPVEIAFHTTFASGARVQVPLGLRWETDLRYLPTGRMLSLSPLEEQLLHGIDTRNQKISGFYTAAGHTALIGDIAYRVSPNFTDWVLFNGGGQEWICVEPQSGPVNGLNFPDCPTLAPGESVMFWQEIGVHGDSNQ